MDAPKRTQEFYALATIACVAALPPFLLLASTLLFPSERTLDAPLIWAYWSIAGCVLGVLAGAILPFRASRWWALLLVPALVDGWFALQLAVGIGLARMH